MNRMKELREALGLNMKEAAQKLSMPYTTYVNYEKGIREPNSETLIQIAKFFGTSIDYLLCRVDSAPAAPAEQKPHTVSYYSSSLTLAQKEALVRYSALNKEGQQKTIAYMDDLLQTERYREPVMAMPLYQESFSGSNLRVASPIMLPALFRDDDERRGKKKD